MKRLRIDLHAGIGWIDHTQRKAGYWFFWKHTPFYPIIRFLWWVTHRGNS